MKATGEYVLRKVTVVLGKHKDVYIAYTRVLGMKTGRATDIRKEYKRHGFIMERLNHTIPVLLREKMYVLSSKGEGNNTIKSLLEYYRVMTWMRREKSYGMLADKVEEMSPAEEARWKMMLDI